MRRFVDTFAGKALCHLVAMALIVPTVTLAVTSRASAQVTQLPSWAVTEFKDLKGANSFKYGQAAADAVASELAKTNKYDVVAQDTVKRSIETLGLTSPLEGLVNLSRVGQDVRASTIVTGEVIDYRVKSVGGGKQALVAIRAVAYDVAGGVPVNGTIEKGESTIRSGNVTNEALINDAIAQAAALAVRTFGTQKSSMATVLNTTDRLALINQGARAGFRTGDTVIISRNGAQVGTGRIGAVEPDQAEMTPERSIGVAPGDKIRTVFSPPELPVKGVSVFTDNDGLITRNDKGRRGGRSNNATLISALLVVGLVGILLGSSNNSNSTSATSRVQAQATLDNGAPAVQINWSPNGFYKGTGTSGNGVARWQVYRSDVSPSNPVLVIGNRSTVVDSSLIDNSDFPTDVFQSNQVGGSQCNYASPATGVRAGAIRIKTGVPVVYSVEAVYMVSSLDLPIVPGTESSSGSTSGSGTSSGNSSGTSSGTSSGSSAGTGTSAGSTAGNTSAGSSAGTAGSSSGTTSGNVSECYFQSGRSSSGQATPLTRPTLGTLNISNFATASFPFTSNQLTGSAGSGQFNQQAIIEFSDDYTFTKKYTVAFTSSAPLSAIATSFTIDTTRGDFSTKKGISKLPLSQASPIYYRIGIRNSADNPGPMTDKASGRRYIYSNTSSFPRPINPPSTPTSTNAVKGKG